LVEHGQKLANVSAWEPNQSQIKFAYRYLRTGIKKDAARFAGVAEQTIYRWFKDPCFLAWFRTTQDVMYLLLDEDALECFRRGMEEGGETGLKYLELFLEATGRLGRHKGDRVSNMNLPEGAAGIMFFGDGKQYGRVRKALENGDYTAD
jgi:hypothetical protein